VHIACRVAKGATCIIARRLYEKHAVNRLSGHWVVADTFADPRVASALQPYLGPADVARFRYANCTVEFRAPVNKDQLDVTVVPR
jgi:hypothetical protein